MVVKNPVPKSKKQRDVPPLPSAEKQFRYNLTRTLLSIMILIDILVALFLIMTVVLAGFANDTAVGTPLFSRTFIVIFVAVGMPAAFITYLLFAAYRSTEIDTPYN